MKNNIGGFHFLWITFVCRSIFGAREVGVELPQWMLGSLHVTDSIEVPINGVFVMDTLETTSEIELAARAHGAHQRVIGVAIDLAIALDRVFVTKERAEGEEPLAVCTALHQRGSAAIFRPVCLVTGGALVELCQALVAAGELDQCCARLRVELGSTLPRKTDQPSTA